MYEVEDGKRRKRREGIGEGDREMGETGEY